MTTIGRFLCRIGLHRWVWLKKFGGGGYWAYQRRECTRCGHEQWKIIGRDAGEDGQ